MHRILVRFIVVATLITTVFAIGALTAGASGFYNETDKKIKFTFCPGEFCLIFQQQTRTLPPGGSTFFHAEAGYLRNFWIDGAHSVTDETNTIELTISCWVEHTGFVRFKRDGNRFWAEVYKADWSYDKSCHPKTVNKWQ